MPNPGTQPASGPPLPQLESVTGTTIATGGERRLSISILAADSSVFTSEWNFITGDVSGPILGNEFIKANNFCIDLAQICVHNLQSGVEHHLETTGPPVTARFRRLDADKLAAAKKIFNNLEASGIVRRSSSSTASSEEEERIMATLRRLSLPQLGDFGGQVSCTQHG